CSRAPAPDLGTAPRPPSPGVGVPPSPGVGLPPSRPGRVARDLSVARRSPWRIDGRRRRPLPGMPVGAGSDRAHH
ncbi:MAG: hypothetical protein AVDCRST_MAG49-4076, partial [uncultured Thermomicrobiales bacterium]